MEFAVNSIQTRRPIKRLYNTRIYAYISKYYYYFYAHPHHNTHKLAIMLEMTQPLKNSLLFSHIMLSAGSVGIVKMQSVTFFAHVPLGFWQRVDRCCWIFLFLGSINLNVFAFRYLRISVPD